MKRNFNCINPFKLSRLLFLCVLLAAHPVPKVQADILTCYDFTTAGGNNYVFYSHTATCADVRAAGAANNVTINSCRTYGAITGSSQQPTYTDIIPLIQGAPSSGSLVSMSLSSGTPGQPAMVVFVHVLDTGIPAYVARLSANGVTLEIASLPSPTIATNTGAFFCENAVKAGEVALLPFQDPPPNPIPTTSDFTLIYASVSSNLTVIESEQVSVNVSALTFTVVPPDKTWDGGGTNGGANFFL